MEEVYYRLFIKLAALHCDSPCDFFIAAVISRAVTNTLILYRYDLI